MTKTQQMRNLDIARGVGICLVVLGHAITKDMADASTPVFIMRTLVYGVHMPLFFFLSGYLFQYRSWDYFRMPAKSFARERFSRLMVPYFAFSVINYLIVYAATAFPGISVVLEENGYKCGSLQECAFQIITFNDHIDTHLWFCYTMFLILIINRLLLKRNTVLTFAILLLVLTFRCVYLTAGNELNPVVNAVMHYLYLFCAGRIWYEHEKDTRTAAALSVVVWILCFAGIAYTKYNGLTPAESVLTPFAELSSSILILSFLSKDLEEKMEHLHAIGMLAYVGKSDVSFPLYLIHMPFIVSGSVVILSRFGLPVVAVILLSTAIGITASLIIRMIVIRYDLAKRVLFGLR